MTERQREFIQAAEQIAAGEGLNRLTIRNVAAAVGVTEPAVYRHFPSKLALLTAILEDLQTSILPHFRKLDYGEQIGNLGKLLESFVRGLFRELESKPAYAAFIFSEEAFHTEPQLRPLLYKMLKETQWILADSFEDLQRRNICRSDLPPQQMAMVTMGTIRLSITRWHLASGSCSLNEMADDIVSSLTALFSEQDGNDGTDETAENAGS